MAKVNLSEMSVEALMDLRKRVDQMLFERRAEIEKRLERMDRAIAVAGSRTGVSDEVHGTGCSCSAPAFKRTDDAPFQSQ